MNIWNKVLTRRIENGKNIEARIHDWDILKEISFSRGTKMGLIKERTVESHNRKRFCGSKVTGFIREDKHSSLMRMGDKYSSLPQESKHKETMEFVA